MRWEQMAGICSMFLAISFVFGYLGVRDRLKRKREDSTRSKQTWARGPSFLSFPFLFPINPDVVFSWGGRSYVIRNSERPREPIHLRWSKTTHHALGRSIV